MQCPQCGDDMVNGACRFCGYRPTAADREAMERWAAQKKSLENGSSAATAKQPAARKASPTRRPARAAEQADAPPKAQKAPKQPARRARAPERTKARDGPGFFGRLLPRAVVVLWAAILIYLIVTELAAGAMP